MGRTSGDPPGDGTRASRPTSLDQLFDLLGHPYRRRILTVLSEADPRDDEEFTLAELRAEDEDPDLVRTELFHHHLPKLEDAGCIDWDREAGTVRHGPEYDEVAPLVDLLVAHEDELPAGWP